MNLEELIPSSFPEGEGEGKPPSEGEGLPVSEKSDQPRSRFRKFIEEYKPESETASETAPRPTEEVLRAGRELYEILRDSYKELANDPVLKERALQLISQPGVYERYKEELSWDEKVKSPEYRKARQMVRDKDILEAEIEKKLNEIAKTQKISIRTKLEIEKEQEKLVGLEAEINQALIENPETGLLLRRRQLLEYRRQLLSQEHFVETPSRKTFIHNLLDRFRNQRPVLITGPTGTGKTVLVRRASAIYSSYEKVSGDRDVTNYDIYGKAALEKGPKGSTVSVFSEGPLIRAMQQGKICNIDEINLIPNSVLMRLKEDLTRRIGDTTTIQEAFSGKEKGFEIRIAPGYALVATENVRSEKHPEREELDPALVRIFDSIRLNYFPKEELFDVALASLIDERGSLLLSHEDVMGKTGKLADGSEKHLGGIVGLVEAAESIQKAYTGEEDESLLKEAVFDPGTFLAIVSGWKIAWLKGKESFGEYLDRKLLDFINKEEFPGEDRENSTKILVSYGFLKTVNPKDLLVSQAEKKLKDFGWKYENPPKPKLDYLSPKEVAELDPFEARAEEMERLASEILGEEVIRKNEVESRIRKLLKDKKIPESVREILGGINPEQ